MIFSRNGVSNMDEQFETCSNCIHEGESGDIVGSSCYLCKRNPEDHRIDWFELATKNIVQSGYPTVERCECFREE